MRMYVDGYEIEVNEPLFYIPLEQVQKTIEELNEYYNNNNLD